MDQISNMILAASLFIIMYGMGLSLIRTDFTRIFVNPKAVLTGLVNQLIFLPLIAFALIAIFPLPPEIAIGVIILAACPGGSTSNLITHLARGDLALSVSLTAISSFISLLTIPFLINLGLLMVHGENTLIQLDIARTVAQVFVIVIIPILLGMRTRAWKPDMADRMERPVRIASAIVFMLVLVGIIIKESDQLPQYINQAGAITLFLNLATMGLGLFTASLMRLPFKQAVSISIESGIQNGTLAISIATVLLANSTYAIAPAVYSLNMFITGGILIFISMRINR